MVIKILAVFLLLSCFLVTAESKAGRSFSGFYEITVQEDLTGRWEKGQKFFVYLRRKGNFVNLFDLANGTQHKGKLSKTTSTEYVVFRGIKLGTEAVNLELTRNRRSNLMTARFRSSLPDAPAELTIASLLSVWACSNHTNPTHAADSEQGMRDLTDKNGCTGWYKLDSSNFN